MVEPAREPKYNIERRVPQNASIWSWTQGLELHRVLLEKLLPERIIVLVGDQRRAEIQAQRLAVALREQQAKTVDSAKKARSRRSSAAKAGARPRGDPSAGAPPATAAQFGPRPYC